MQTFYVSNRYGEFVTQLEAKSHVDAIEKAKNHFVFMPMVESETDRVNTKKRQYEERDARYQNTGW